MRTFKNWLKESMEKSRKEMDDLKKEDREDWEKNKEFYAELADLTDKIRRLGYDADIKQEEMERPILDKWDAVIYSDYRDLMEKLNSFEWLGAKIIDIRFMYGVLDPWYYMAPFLYVFEKNKYQEKLHDMIARLKVKLEYVTDEPFVIITDKGNFEFLFLDDGVVKISKDTIDLDKLPKYSYLSRAGTMLAAPLIGKTINGCHIDFTQNGFYNDDAKIWSVGSININIGGYRLMISNVYDYTKVSIDEFYGKFLLNRLKLLGKL